MKFIQLPRSEDYLEGFVRKDKIDAVAITKQSIVIINDRGEPSVFVLPEDEIKQEYVRILNELER